MRYMERMEGRSSINSCRRRPAPINHESSASPRRGEATIERARRDERGTGGTFAANDPLRHVKGEHDVHPEDEVDEHVDEHNRSPEAVLPESRKDAGHSILGFFPAKAAAALSRLVPGA